MNTALSFLFGVLIVIGLPACSESPAPAAPPITLLRPNILWITCEDLSPIIAAFGDSTIATPNLSRLAARGVRYPNTFSVSGVCAPSRNALTLGMYPTSTGGLHMRSRNSPALMEKLGLEPYGALPPPEARMMSDILRTHGYFCTNNQKEDYQFEAPKTAWDENGIRAHWRHRGPGQPFFSIFNLAITHESQVWQTSRNNLRFQRGFEEAGSEIAGGVFPAGERPAVQLPDDLAVPVPPYLPSTAPVIEDVRRVYDNIRIMDEQVGFLLEQLEQDGLTDSTIIFFYSDHGGPLPRQKRLLYDSGIRVPLIVAWPDDRRAGTTDSTLWSFVDMAPTVFSLTGIPVPDYVQGQANLGAQAAPPRDYVFAAADRLDAYYDRIRAARDQRFKYLRNYYPERPYYLPLAYRERMGSMQELLRLSNLGQLDDAQAQWFRQTKPPEELFDTYADPYELRNLASDPAYAGKLAELRRAMDDWQAEVGDLGDLPEIELVQRFWEGEDEMPKTGRPQLKRDSIGRFILESKTPGARIAYRITPDDRDRPGWRVYTNPFEYERGDTVRAVAQRIGYRESGLSIGF